MRTAFEKELNEVNNIFFELVSLVENTMKDSLEALQNCDKKLANSIVIRDDEINALEKKIENLCLQLLLRQQPVARDLRMISTVLKVITDLERIGDQNADIAEIINSSDEKFSKRGRIVVEKMYDEVLGMFKQAIDAFNTGNETLAKEVAKKDDIVDALYMELRNICIEEIEAKSDEVQGYLDLLQIGKYLERIGDHSENIAEWVIFSVTGYHPSF